MASDTQARAELTRTTATSSPRLRRASQCASLSPCPQLDKDPSTSSYICVHFISSLAILLSRDKPSGSAGFSYNRPRVSLIIDVNVYLLLSGSPGFLSILEVSPRMKYLFFDWRNYHFIIDCCNTNIWNFSKSACSRI